MKLKTLFALASLALSFALLAEEGKYSFDPKAPPVAITKLAGLGSLKIEEGGVVLTQSPKTPDFDIKNAKGAKKAKLSLKLGEEFQISSRNERSVFRLDKVEGDWAFFSCYRKFQKGGAALDGSKELSYPCKIRAFDKED